MILARTIAGSTCVPKLKRWQSSQSLLTLLMSSLRTFTLVVLLLQSVVLPVPTSLLYWTDNEKMLIITHSDLGCDWHFAGYFRKERMVFKRTTPVNPDLNFNYQNITAPSNPMNDDPGSIDAIATNLHRAHGPYT